MTKFPPVCLLGVCRPSKLLSEGLSQWHLFSWYLGILSALMMQWSLAASCGPLGVCLLTGCWLVTTHPMAEPEPGPGGLTWSGVRGWPGRDKPAPVRSDLRAGHTMVSGQWKYGKNKGEQILKNLPFVHITYSHHRSLKVFSYLLFLIYSYWPLSIVVWFFLPATAKEVQQWQWHEAWGRTRLIGLKIKCIPLYPFTAIWGLL